MNFYRKINNFAQRNKYAKYFVEIFGEYGLLIFLPSSLLYFSILFISFLREYNDSLPEIIVQLILFSLYFILPLIIAILLNKLLKFKRPFEKDNKIKKMINIKEKYAFPSIHATFLSAITLIILLSWVGGFSWVFLVLTVLISVARIIAGVHYVRDILFGYFITVFIQAFLIYITFFLSLHNI